MSGIFDKTVELVISLEEDEIHELNVLADAEDMGLEGYIEALIRSRL